MKRLTFNLFRGLSLSMLAVVAVGCMAAQSDHPYSPTPTEAIPVPPGARIIAFGHYPIGQFTIPHEPGSLYVWDVDARQVALLTSAAAGSQVSDLNQLSKNSFDPTHNYRVYFIPAGAVTMTTQPAVSQ